MHFSCLSKEVIEIILSYNDISFEDIINFRCVCKQFSQAARDEFCFLKTKYSQRWPIAKEHYDKNFKKNKKDEKQLNFIKIGLSCARQLRHVVSQIIPSNYYDNAVALDDIDMYDYGDVNHTHFKFLNYLLEDLKEIISETDDYIILIFFMDEIKNLLSQFPGRSSCDLTERYYYVLLYDILRSYLWQNYFDKFQEYYHKEHLLERSATIMADWLQPNKNVLYSNVKTSLDTIALEVLNCLREVNSNHPIFSTTDKTFTDLKNNKNIEDNYWNETEGTEIINTLEKYIFGDKFKFLLDSSDDYMYTCIDYILENEKGDEMNLLLIYQSVARRLGLRCEIVKPPGEPNLQLFWKPKYTDDMENIRIFTINVDCNPPVPLSYKLLDFQPLYHSSIVYSKIIRKEAYILEPKQVLETLQSFPNVRRFVEHYYLLSQLKYLACYSKSQETKFAVGMIVRHGDCSDGVIVGWMYSRKPGCACFEISSKKCGDCSTSIDPDAFMELKYFSYLREDEIHLTILYIILHNNDTICHVKEDDITLTTPTQIDNDVGHYFCKFEKTHYVPNKILEKIYPQNAAIIAKRIFKN